MIIDGKVFRYVSAFVGGALTVLAATLSAGQVPGRTTCLQALGAGIAAALCLHLPSPKQG